MHLKSPKSLVDFQRNSAYTESGFGGILSCEIQAQKARWLRKFESTRAMPRAFWLKSDNP
jgi:hypothetical protein